MNVALRLPDSLGKSLKEFTRHENISMNQLISTAIAERLSAPANIRLSPSKSQRE